MAPEHAPSLVILDARMENGELRGSCEYIEPTQPRSRLRVRWAVDSQPEGFVPVGGGVAYVYTRDAAFSVVPISKDAHPASLGEDRYRWTEGLNEGIPWVMFVLILPAGHTLMEPSPAPAGARVFGGRLALYWVLRCDDLGRTEVQWTLRALQTDCKDELVRLNRALSSAPPAHSSSLAIEDSTGTSTWAVKSLVTQKTHGAGSRARSAMHFDKPAQRSTAVILGVGFLLLILGLALARPNPTPFQYAVFRIVLSLAGAGFAATIPGFLEVTLSTVVRATGAIAVFVVVYFFSPARLVVQPRANGGLTLPGDPVSFEAVTPPEGVQGKFSGSVSLADSALLVRLDSGVLSYPVPGPDGEGRFIEYYRVSLAGWRGDAWELVRAGQKQPLNLPLPVGGKIDIGSRSLNIPVSGVTSLTGHWLVFEISLKLSQTDLRPGFWYAQTRMDLF